MKPQSLLPLKKDDILKINFKYEILKSRTTTTFSYEMDVDRYGIEVLLRVMRTDLTISAEDLSNLICEKFLKEKICLVQVDKVIWKLITITNLTTNTFILRLPIPNCRGQLPVSLNQISLTHSYVYHLFKSGPTPFTFSLKGIPKTYMGDPEFESKLAEICNLFLAGINVLPKDMEDLESESRTASQKKVVSSADANSSPPYLKYVKISSSRAYSKIRGGTFIEIDSCYPWGFKKDIVRKKRTKKRKPASKKRKIAR